MPRPMLRLLEKMIEEKGGDDYILTQVAEGTSKRKIIEEFINPNTGKSFNRGMLYYWRNLNPDRKKAWAEACEIAAHNLMDDSMEDLENPGNFITPADVALMKERNAFRRYLAERYNRREFGKEDPDAPAGGVNVNLNLGDAFLLALRQHGNAHVLHGEDAPAALPADVVTEADFEMEDPDA